MVSVNAVRNLDFPRTTYTLALYESKGGESVTLLYLCWHLT